MKISQIIEYLEIRINKWYQNSFLDYGIGGKFIRAEVSGADLRIIWEEDEEQRDVEIAWYSEYNAEELYNIWMEAA